MKLIPHTIDNISFLLIEELYNEEELFYIENEIYFLWLSSNFKKDQNYLESAESKQKKIAKRSGIWLDTFYSDRDSSMILKYNRKPLIQTEIVETFKNINPYHNNYSQLNSDHTLLSYYENSDFYKPHVDASCYTLVTWFFNEPKKFFGGNFKFTKLNYEIEIKSNMCVIFPSFLLHEVENIKMNETSESTPFGRFSMSQFILWKN